MAAEKHFIFFKEWTECFFHPTFWSGHLWFHLQSLSLTPNFPAQPIPAASMFSWLDWQLQHTKHFKLVLSVGNAWKDILSSFWQAALTISVSLCSTQVLLRIFHVRYLIRAKCVVGVLHQHSHNSWIAVGFIHTHLLHGKSVVSTSLWC